LKNLFKTILKQDEEALSLIAREVDLDPKVIQFLGQVALTPSIHALRDAMSSNIDTDGWDYGYCPLCGSQPDMAYLQKPARDTCTVNSAVKNGPFPESGALSAITRTRKRSGISRRRRRRGSGSIFAENA